MDLIIAGSDPPFLIHLLTRIQIPQLVDQIQQLADHDQMGTQKVDLIRQFYLSTSGRARVARKCCGLINEKYVFRHVAHVNISNVRNMHSKQLLNYGLAKCLTTHVRCILHAVHVAFTRGVLQ